MTCPQFWFFYIPSELRIYILQFFVSTFFSQNLMRKKVAIPFIIFLFCGGNKLPYFYTYNKTEILRPAPNYFCSYMCVLCGWRAKLETYANKSVLKSNQYRAQGLQQTDIDQDRTHTHTHTLRLDLLPVLSGKYCFRNIKITPVDVPSIFTHTWEFTSGCAWF